MPGTVDLKIKLETHTRQDGDVWVANYPSLDVFGQGASPDKAFASLRTAIELWFESCIERGVLEEALGEAGFKPLGIGSAAGTAAPSPSLLEVSIPCVAQSFVPPVHAAR